VERRLYVIAGEASGDMHGANVLRALRAQGHDVHVRAWGGGRMQAEGAHIVKHYRELAFMGFVEVLLNLRTILRNLSVCKADIAAWKPDVLLLIDYPGFNMRMAKWAHAQGIQVLYYISPQIWAWKEGRVHTLKRSVHRMFTILPFEKAFYAKHGMEVEFVGHPLLDEIERSDENPSPPVVAPSDEPLVALLPGSRKQEIENMLPEMLEAAKQFPQYRFLVAAAPGIAPAYYQRFLKHSNVQVVVGNTYGLLRQAHGALVTSGTATLEAALLNVPLAVCYKGSPISIWLARRLVRVKHISLVNLVVDDLVVPELIQQDMNAQALVQELGRLMEPGVYRSAMLERYAHLRKVLGGPGASNKVATEVWKSLNSPGARA
jgi:lipid-A-disaccharide synthase